MENRYHDLRIDYGFVYLSALIDVYSRFIVGWSLSNTLDAQACLRTLEKTISNQGVPDIVNSDQGVQFTSEAWVKELTRKGSLNFGLFWYDPWGAVPSEL